MVDDEVKETRASSGYELLGRRWWTAGTGVGLPDPQQTFVSSQQSSYKRCGRLYGVMTT